MLTLSVSIITRNREDILKRCLFSIYNKIKDIDYEVIVVDNHSSDGTVQMIMNEFSNVILIKNKVNLGVAGGRNKILDIYQGNFLLFLDDDTEILSPNFRELIDFMKKKDIGITGCRIITNDKIYPSARKFPKPINVIAKRLSFIPFLKKSSLLRPYREFLIEDKNPVEVDWVMGAFQLMKREAQEKVGKLDEIMKFGFEDADYCARMKKSSYTVWYYPAFEVIHYKGVVSERTFSKYTLYFLRSYFWFYLKHRDLMR
jgi:hypothetical protein